MKRKRNALKDMAPDEEKMKVGKLFIVVSCEILDLKHHENGQIWVKLVRIMKDCLTTSHLMLIC